MYLRNIIIRQRNDIETLKCINRFRGLQSKLRTLKNTEINTRKIMRCRKNSIGESWWEKKIS